MPLDRYKGARAEAGGDSFLRGVGVYLSIYDDDSWRLEKHCMNRALA